MHDSPSSNFSALTPLLRSQNVLKSAAIGLAIVAVGQAVIVCQLCRDNDPELIYALWRSYVGVWTCASIIMVVDASGFVMRFLLPKQERRAVMNRLHLVNMVMFLCCAFLLYNVAPLHNVLTMLVHAAIRCYFYYKSLKEVIKFSQDVEKQC